MVCLGEGVDDVVDLWFLGIGDDYDFYGLFLGGRVGGSGLNEVDVGVGYRGFY